MIAHHVRIHGLVQGVGFRAWLVRTATARGLTGWVRNRGHDGVEALLQGEAGAVAEVLLQCRQGPPAARVSSVEDSITAREELDRFTERATLA